MRVVVDTNVLISAALAIRDERSNSPNWTLVQRIVEGSLISITSARLLYELRAKLETPKFGLSVEFSSAFVELTSRNCEMVPVRGLDMGCRDRDDNALIETAYDGRVAAPITRDRDLKDDRVRYGLEKRACLVLTAEEFLRRFPEFSALVSGRLAA